MITTPLLLIIITIIVALIMTIMNIAFAHHHHHHQYNISKSIYVNAMSRKATMEVLMVMLMMT